MRDAAANEVLSRQVKDWLLAFLRLAATRDDADREAFLARAREMDRGGHFEAPAFSFFVRTSTELCDALTKDDPQSRAALERLLGRIGASRLRGTLQTAIGAEPALAIRETRARSLEYLWQGLGPRSQPH